MSIPDSLRRTIATAENLQGIVRTMKTLAAISIHQYEQAVAAVADYERAVRLGLAAFLNETAPVHPRGSNLAVSKAREPAIGVVAFGSDHGLCGRFNEDLAEQIRAILAQFPGYKQHVLVVGARLAAEGALGGRAGQHRFVPGADISHPRCRDRHRADPAATIAGFGAMAESGSRTVAVVSATPPGWNASDALHAGATAARPPLVSKFGAMARTFAAQPLR